LPLKKPPVWQNPWVVTWTQFLLNSYRQWTGNDLIDREGDEVMQSERLFVIPFVVVSHGTQPDPLLNYGNHCALTLWEMDWDGLRTTPSRLTAEPINQEERARMLREASQKGIITDYRGIRISRTGRRFSVEHAVVWNVLNGNGRHCGQAATFSTWKELPIESRGIPLCND